MSLATISGVLALASLQGSLVALPDARAFGRLRRFRSPAWALLLPGLIVVGTFGVVGLPATAFGLVALAALATPPLAAVSALAIVRVPGALPGRRTAPVAVIVALTAVAVLAGGLAAEAAASVISAVGTLVLGVGIVRLIPPRWVHASVLAMAAVDIALLAVGPGHSAAGAMVSAQHQFHGPAFNQASIGSVSVDYPDLVLAAALGSTAAEDRDSQRRAAVLLATLAGLYGLLLAVIDVIPATVPIAVTYFVLRWRRSPARGLPAAFAGGRGSCRRWREPGSRGQRQRRLDERRG